MSSYLELTSLTIATLWTLPVRAVELASSNKTRFVTSQSSAPTLLASAPSASASLAWLSCSHIEESADKDLLSRSSMSITMKSPWTQLSTSPSSQCLNSIKDLIKSIVLVAAHQEAKRIARRALMNPKVYKAAKMPVRATNQLTNNKCRKRLQSLEASVQVVKINRLSKNQLKLRIKFIMLPWAKMMLKNSKNSLPCTTFQSMNKERLQVMPSHNAVVAVSASSLIKTTWAKFRALKRACQPPLNLPLEKRTTQQQVFITLSQVLILIRVRTLMTQSKKPKAAKPASLLMMNLILIPKRNSLHNLLPLSHLTIISQANRVNSTSKLTKNTT